MEFGDKNRLVQLIVLVAGAMFIGEHLFDHFWKALTYLMAGLYAVDSLRWFEDWQQRQRAKDEAKRAHRIDWTTFPPSWPEDGKAEK